MYMKSTHTECHDHLSQHQIFIMKGYALKGILVFIKYAKSSRCIKLKERQILE